MKSDSFSAFFIKYFEHSYEGKVKKNDLRKYYADFCRKNQLRPMSDKMIKRKMQEEGVIDDESRFEGSYESFWLGLKVKDKYEVIDKNKYSQIKNYESERTLAFIEKITEESQSELKLKEQGYN